MTHSSKNSGDGTFMHRALALAARGRGCTSPNPLVGAVVVAPDGVVVGSGFHERAGEAHAEVRALDAAGTQARGATLYCTLEPCCHTGRTGPCVERIVASGISRVVASMEDPNPLVSGGGFKFLRDRGIAVEVGEGRQEATRMNAPFLTVIRRQRPFVIMKVATSLDGCISRPGIRLQLTSMAARRRLHRTRAEVDAIGVGSGTVLVDDPLLTVQEVWRGRPLTRVVFDRRLRTPATARLWSTLDAGPVIIVTTPRAIREARGQARDLRAAGAILEPLPDFEADETQEEADAGSFARALGVLRGMGLTSLLLEGGALIHAAAWRAGVVDRVQVFVAPVHLGAQGIRWMDGSSLALASLSNLRVEPCGSDVFIEGDVHRTD